MYFHDCVRRAAPVLGLVLSLWPHAVGAQTISPEKLARGEQLYNEAIALMEQSKFSEACPKLEEVLRLVPEGVGAKIELARCYENDGRLASAWKAYKMAEASAAQAGQAERTRKAADGAATIEGKLSSLTIVVPESVRTLPDFQITRNGSVVDPMDWGTAIPVDGGSYRLEATASGKEKWTTTVEIGPSGKKERVEIGALVDAVVHQEKPARIPAPLRPWQKPVGAAVAGVGFVGVVVGAVLGGLAISKHDDSNSNNHCDMANRCDGTGLELRREALTFANASTGLFVVGGVLMAGGVVLFATAPKKGTPSDAKSVTARAWNGDVALGPSGFILRGTW